MIIAIQKDDYGVGDASSPRWAELLVKAGHEVRWVNVYGADILEQVRGCQGFMWRWAHFDGMYRVARRLLPVLERELGLVMYPDQATCWHYDDKAAQALLFAARGVPTPRTWVWYSRRQAEAWAAGASYPLVAKLTGGAGSTNVRLIKDVAEAKGWLETMWQRGMFKLTDAGAEGVMEPRLEEYHYSYALFQEFMAGNLFDTRITAIGKYAFGYRRFNRDDDFRASGSGRNDYDHTAIDPRFVRLAYQTARKLGMHSCAIDGLYRGGSSAQGEVVTGEVSYTYISRYLNNCPGHWELQGEADTGEMRWVSGTMWPEEAQVEEFLQRLERKHL